MSAEIDPATWGRVAPAELERIAVVSPHFDDAAMGAGHLIAGHDDATVVTVFGGSPPAYPEQPTEWDALGGFGPGEDVVAVRRLEDAAAMAVLGAGHRWLEFSDHQYLAPPERPSAEQVATALHLALSDLGPSAVLVPMGLGNPDHVVAHDAALIVRQRLPDLAWFCYEDHGYKHIPGLLAWRVAKLLKDGPWATPAIIAVRPDPERKKEAIWCYRSQIAPLEREHALTERVAADVPEQFWRLAPPPKGWEALAQLV